MHPFRAAVESGRLSSVPDLLAADVRFLSPVAFTPYVGKPVVAQILAAAFDVFEDFGYTREIEDGPHHALMFAARVGSRQVHGCDFVVTGDDGLITEFCVMVRPLSGAHALAEAMAEKLATFQP